MSVPAFKDISKQSNDILSRDFYHFNPLSLELSTVAPNNVSFAVEGKSNAKSDVLSGKLEGRYADKATGVTLTQGWLTSNVLNTKIDVRDFYAKGLDGSIDTTWLLATGAKTAKASLNFKHPGINANVFADPFKRNIISNIVLGNNGFLFGTEVGYDIPKGQTSHVTSQIGYRAATYNVALIASNSFKLFTASVFHQASVATQIGARATVDRNSNSGVGLEAAIRHTLDPGAFVKAKLNNQSVACFSYSQRLRPGVTLGVGLETNILKLNEASHKLGLSLKFAA